MYYIKSKTKDKDINCINSGIFKYSYNIKRNIGWLKIKVLNDIGNILFNRLKSNINNIERIDSHITVVRGESIVNLRNWEKYKDCLINFDVDNNIKNNKQYYWVDIYCPFLYIVRKELDITSTPLYPFHLTIGKKKLNR